MGIGERYLARGCGQGTRLHIKHEGFGASSTLIYGKYGWNHHPLLWGKDIPPPRGDRLPENDVFRRKRLQIESYAAVSGAPCAGAVCNTLGRVTSIHTK